MGPSQGPISEQDCLRRVDLDLPAGKGPAAQTQVVVARALRGDALEVAADLRDRRRQPLDVAAREEEEGGGGQRAHRGGGGLVAEERHLAEDVTGGQVSE